MHRKLDTENDSEVVLTSQYQKTLCHNTVTKYFISLKWVLVDWSMFLCFHSIHPCVQVEDLGLEKDVLSVRSDNVASKNRYLYVNKKLHRMPSGLR